MPMGVGAPDMRENSAQRGPGAKRAHTALTDRSRALVLPTSHVRTADDAGPHRGCRSLARVRRSHMDYYYWYSWPDIADATEGLKSIPWWGVVLSDLIARY